MDFGEFELDIKDFASRLRCRLDNAHMLTARQIEAGRLNREASTAEP